MSLPKRYYPRRLPENLIAKVYASVEEAFEANDYFYVTRYGRDNPELLGCALLFLGNRVGGERVLDRHNVRTGRSFVYRACAAWIENRNTDAQKWIAEGRACGDVDEEMALLSALTDRQSFRIVIYEDVASHKFPIDYPGLEIICVPYQSSGAPRFPEQPMDSSQGADLVIADFVTHQTCLHETSNVEIANWEAPVVLACGDHEWRNDQLERVLSKVDLLSCGASSEAVEVGRAFDKDCAVLCPFPLRPYFEMKGLAKRFAETADRKIDLLFTGGMTHDFFRDKRSRILSLVSKIDKKFDIKFKEGFLSEKEYKLTLGMTRFVPISSRFSGYWSARNIEALSAGVINLVSCESFMPYAFSELFTCFQTYDNDNPAIDIETHLNSYDKIVSGFLPQAPQLEAEMCSLFPNEESRWAQYLRRLIFIAHRNKFRAAREKNGRSASSLTETNREAKAKHGPPADKTVRAGQWLRRAFACSSESLADRSELMAIIDEGLKHYPDSMCLRYARALLLRNDGEWAQAEDIFRSIVEGRYVVEMDDPFPYPWDHLHGAYWVMDARLRARCASYLAPLTPEIDVWKSFALSHLANFALMKISLDESRNATQKSFMEVAALAKRAVDLFNYNDTAQRMYLRAAYRLHSLGLDDWGEEFLQSYDAIINMDGRILNDFAAMAVDVLTALQRTREVNELVEKLSLFLSRVYIPRPQFPLYPEVLPLLIKYNLPHGGLIKTQGY